MPSSSSETTMVSIFSNRSISVQPFARSLPKSDRCLLGLSVHSGRRWIYPAALQQPHPLDSIRCARLCPSLSAGKRRARSCQCYNPRLTGHRRNSPRDNRPDKSNSLPSALTQAPVPQPMENLHLTNSQACPKATADLIDVADAEVGPAFPCQPVLQSICLEDLGNPRHYLARWSFVGFYVSSFGRECGAFPLPWASPKKTESDDCNEDRRHLCRLAQNQVLRVLPPVSLGSELRFLLSTSRTSHELFGEIQKFS